MRTLLFSVLLLWLLAGLGFGWLFGHTPYVVVAQALTQPNYAAEFAAVPPALTPTRYEALRWGSWLVAGVAALGLVACCFRRQLSESAGTKGLVLAWGPTRGGKVPARWQLATTLALAAGAVGLRLWLARATPITTDELTSYDYYARPGAAVAASVYTLPNNHILYNLLVASLPRTLPPDVAQRLPAVVVGLLLLPLAYLGLRRHLRWETATLALALFAYSPTPAFYAIAGRGYGVQLAAAVTGLLATLVLVQRQGQHGRAWAGWVLSAVAGLYAVPTHLYVLGPLGLVLLLALARRPGSLRRPALARLAVAGAATAAATALLYAPVGLVSGWGPLLRNPYVRPLGLSEFWGGLGAYLPEMATRLWGQGSFTLAWLAVLAAAAPLALRHAGDAARRVGGLCYALTYMPLAMLAAQRVQVPGRALLPAMLASLLLLAVVAQVVAGQLLAARPAWRATARRRFPVVLAASMAAYASYRFHREAVGLRALAIQHTRLQAQRRWLVAQHPTRVWLDSLSRPYQGIYWHHLAVSGQPPLSLRVASQLPAKAAGQAEYAVADRQHGGRVPAALARQPPAYQDEAVSIWRLPQLAAVLARP